MLKNLKALDIAEERTLAGWMAAGLYAVASVTVLLMLMMPGVPRDHWLVVVVCATGAALWTLAAVFLVRWPTAHPIVSHLSSAMGFVLVAIVMAATGGASSPARYFLFFTVFYCSWFYPPREASLYLLGCIATVLLPLLYDSDASDSGYLGDVMVLAPTFLIVGLLVMLGKRLMVGLRAEAQELARRDPLTGLINRRALFPDMDELKGEGLGLLLLDLDDFKEANTHYGHPGGDRVLREVVRSLADVAGDGLCARIGGDEFAVILPHGSSGEMNQMAQDMLRSLPSLERELDMPGFVLSASIGWAIFPEHATTISELFEIADLSLRGAKANGKARAHSAGDPHAITMPPTPVADAHPIWGLASRTRQILDRLPRQACDVLAADRAIITMIDTDEPGFAVGVAGHNVDEDFLGMRFPLDQGLVGRVMRTGEPQFVNDYSMIVQKLDHAATNGLCAVVAVPMRWAGKVRGSLSVAMTTPDRAFSRRDAAILTEIADVGALALEGTEMAKRLEGTVRGGVEAMAAAVDLKDSYTAEHSEEVLDLARTVGRRLRLDENAMAELEFGARLHDLGKIGVPDHILRKEGPLDEEEWEIMRQHPVWGGQLLADIPGLERVAAIVRAEHERWDGGGYPDGLRGAEIPLAARIVFACDSFHAMISDRPYRKALTTHVAIDELCDNSGSQFDPVVADALVAVLEPTPTPAAN